MKKLNINNGDKFTIDIDDGRTEFKGTHKTSKKIDKQIQSEFKEHTNKEITLKELQSELKFLQQDYENNKNKSEIPNLNGKEKLDALNKCSIIIKNIKSKKDEFESLASEIDEFELAERVGDRRIEKTVIVDEENKQILDSAIEANGSAIVYTTILEAVQEGKREDTKI